MMPIWKSIVYVSSKCKMYNMDSDEASIVQLAHNVVTDHMVLEYIEDCTSCGRPLIKYI